MQNLMRWLFGIIILSIILFLGIQFILTPWLEHKAHNAIQEHTNPHFRIEVKDIEINLFHTSISTDSLYLYWLSSASPKEKNLGRELQFQIKTFKASDISIWQWLMNDRVEVGKLNISEPKLQIEKKKLQEEIEKDTSSFSTQISGIKIRNLEIDTTTFQYIDSIKNTKFISGFKKMQAGIQLSFNKMSGINIQPDNSHIQITDYTASLPSGFYDLRIKQFHLSGKDSLLQLDSLTITPLFDKYEFSQNYGYRTDRVLANIEVFKSNGLDVQTLVNKGEFHAEMLSLSGLYTDIFRDARLPFKPGKFTVLVQKKLKNVPFTFTVDSTLLEKAKIRYEEKRIDEQSTGVLLLEDIKIEGGRLTNDSVLMKQTVYTPMGTAIFMGTGRLKADFHFPLSRNNGYHRVSGHMGPMPITKVNTVLYPLTTFRIESGQNDNVYFNMSLDEMNAKGDMKFYYHDLKIKMGTEKEKWLNDIGSYLANQVIRSENPKNGEFNEGVITYKRDTKRSIFNYWWKALRSGLLTSVGLSPDIVK